MLDAQHVYISIQIVPVRHCIICLCIDRIKVMCFVTPKITGWQTGCAGSSRQQPFISGLGRGELQSSGTLVFRNRLDKPKSTVEAAGHGIELLGHGFSVPNNSHVCRVCLSSARCFHWFSCFNEAIHYFAGAHQPYIHKPGLFESSSDFVEGICVPAPAQHEHVDRKHRPGQGFRTGFIHNMIPDNQRSSGFQGIVKSSCIEQCSLPGCSDE